MSLCRVCRLCHALSRRVTHTTSHSDTLYCLSLCHSILSVTLPLCHSVAQTVCRSVCPLTLSLVGLSLTLPGGLSPIYYLSACVETRGHSRQMRARIASGLQGLTGSSGTRAGDIWKKANQDLENSRGFQDNYLGGLLKWSPRTLVYIIPSFSIQN